MKKLILFLILSPLIAFSQVTEDWVSPENNYAKQARRAAVDINDNVFTLTDIFHGDIYLSKRDKAGNILWSVGYDNTTPSQWEVAADIVIDINGDAVVTGYTNTGFGSQWYAVQMVTMKFKGTDGSLLWRSTNNTGSAHRGRRCLTDASGNIYVGGDINAFNTSYYETGNMVVIKYDTNGNEQWSVYLNENGLLMPGPLDAMKFDPEGNLVIAGSSPTTSQSAYAKININGSVAWSFTTAASGTADIAASADGNYYAVYSYYYGAQSNNFVIKKLTNNGAEIWVKNYDFGSFELARQMEVDHSGSVIVMGYGSQVSGMPYVDWITFKVNSSGVQQWYHRYNEHANNDEWPWQMAIDDQDNVYVTGQGGPWPGGPWTSLTQMITLKYQSGGTEEWVAKQSANSSVGKAICLASDNSIYAIGYDGVTIHYVQQTTLVCSTPINLTAVSVTSNSEKILWTAVPGAFQYEIWYKKSSKTNWKIKYVAGNKSFTKLNNLTCNINYDWKIRTICDTSGNDLISELSSVQSFVTASCREGTAIVIEPLQLNVYPNPADKEISFVTHLEGDIQLSVIDVNGRLVISKNIFVYENETIQLNIAQLNQGVYFLELVGEEGKLKSQFVINR